MTTEERRSHLGSIGLSRIELSGLRELVNETLLRNSNRRQWERKRVDEQEAWTFDMATLIRDEGLDRVRAGMRACWTRIPHLPSPSEVREHLPARECIKPRLHDPNCADCSGTGWEYVTIYSEFYGRDEQRVKKCDCNIRPHQPRKANDAADSAYITSKVAELDAALEMPATRTPYRLKSAVPAPAIPIVSFTPQQIEQRKPMERAEAARALEDLEARTNGRYERQA